MPLKGEAKKTYQREYMRGRRAKAKLKGTLLDPPTLKPVRPVQPKSIPPDGLAVLDRGMAKSGSINRGSFAQYVIDADGNPIYED